MLVLCVMVALCVMVVLCVPAEPISLCGTQSATMNYQVKVMGVAPLISWVMGVPLAGGTMASVDSS